MCYLFVSLLPRMLSCASNACFSFPFPSFTTIFFSWCNCATSVAIPFVSNMCASMQGTVEALSGWSSLSCSALFAGHNIYSLPDSRSYTHSLPLYLHIWMLCFPCRCLVLVVLDAHVGAWFTFTTPTLDCLADFNRSADMLVVAFASLRIRSLGFYFLICCYLRIIIRSVLLLIPFYSFSVFYRLLRTGVPTVSFWRAFCWKSFLEGDVRVCLRFMLALIWNVVRPQKKASSRKGSAIGPRNIQSQVVPMLTFYKLRALNMSPRSSSRRPERVSEVCSCNRTPAFLSSRCPALTLGVRVHRFTSAPPCPGNMISRLRIQNSLVWCLVDSGDALPLAMAGPLFYYVACARRCVCTSRARLFDISCLFRFPYRIV